MLLATIVEVSRSVRATRARSEKVTRLSGCLAQADPAELPIVTAYLAGQLPQGRVDVGWRTLQALDVPSAPAATLAVADVDEAVDRLTAVGGEGSQAQRKAILTTLLAAATEAEQIFLRGLLLGELRQGALEGVVVQAVAKAFGVPQADVRRAVMLHADLGEVARIAATGGLEALRAVRLRLFAPVQPMLASTAKSAAEAVGDLGTCAVEAKLDGARIQVHRDGERIAVYSRSLRDITGEVPAVVEVARALAVDRVILDGEVLGIGEEGLPAAFQDTMSGLAGGVPFFFDCLLAEDQDLLDAPLSERRAALEDAVPAAHLVDRWVVTSIDEAEDAYARVLDARHEGVVVKDLDAPYAAGRRGSAWRKVKPVRTLDCVVLAAEWGSGRRKGWLSNLHLGARDPDGGFVMLGKTFKGLTDAVLEWQTQELLAREVGREGHIVHVRPELVVEIALDGVVRSPRYPGGVALRFARVVRYREDKSPDEADAIATVQAMRAG